MITYSLEHRTLRQQRFQQATPLLKKKIKNKSKSKTLKNIKLKHDNTHLCLA